MVMDREAWRPSVCWSLQCVISALTQGGGGGHFFLGSLVQSCCGEGGTVQTNITDGCGECSQCLSHTGFSPAHGVCAFLVYPAQAPGCSPGNCLKRDLGCQMSHFFTSGGQTIGVSTSASVLLVNIQDWFPLGLTGWISLQSKGLSRVFSTPQFKSINSSVLSFLYSPTLPSILFLSVLFFSLQW